MKNSSNTQVVKRAPQELQPVRTPADRPQREGYFQGWCEIELLGYEPNENDIREVDYWTIYIPEYVPNNEMRMRLTAWIQSEEHKVWWAKVNRWGKPADLKTDYDDDF